MIRFGLVTRTDRFPIVIMVNARRRLGTDLRYLVHSHQQAHSFALQCDKPSFPVRAASRRWRPAESSTVQQWYPREVKQFYGQAYHNDIQHRYTQTVILVRCETTTVIPVRCNTTTVSHTRTNNRRPFPSFADVRPTMTPSSSVSGKLPVLTYPLSTWSILPQPPSFLRTGTDPDVVYLRL